MKNLIARYQLSSHPEGGYFREIYRSGQRVFSPHSRAERSALTHIYFLLVAGQVSRFHKVCHDEIWNFYAGAPLRLICRDEAGGHDCLLGGDGGDYVAVVPGGCYQAAETTGDYSLVGCSVAPGFDFTDFSFLADNAADAALIETLDADLRRLL